MTKRNSNLANHISSDYMRRNDYVNRWGNLIATYQSLPGLAGLWPMSAVGAAGEAVDMSGLGNHLSRTGGGVFGGDGVIPYVSCDGGDYHQITDGNSNNIYDILGNEAFMFLPGLTFGAWVKFAADAGAGSQSILAKWTDAAPSYQFQRRTSGNGGVGRFRIDSGGSISSAQGTAELLGGQWYSIVCRYIPGSQVQYFLNGEAEAANLTGIPATISNTAQALTIGANSDGSSSFSGQISMAFVCQSYLLDMVLFSLFEQARVIFGV